MRVLSEISAVQGLDPVALLPVIAPAAGLLLILLVDAAAPRGARLRRVHDVLAGLSLLGSGAAVGWLAADGGLRQTLCVPGDDAGACSYVVSQLTGTLQAVTLVAAAVALLLTLDGPGSRQRAVHHVLFLAAVTGALALAGSRDLISMVVALETATLPAVGLVALRRDAQGAQGALTMLLSAVASLVLLALGAALLLLASGSLHLSRIGAVLADPQLPGAVRSVAVLGTVLMVAGIGFKLSAVPFHLWTPDTYAGAPLPIAAFLATVSKAAAVAALAVLLGVGLPGLGADWAPVVGVLGALSATVGNLVAIRQRVAVRLLAWSTVAQAGWVLLPLALFGQASAGAARSAVSASVGYLLAYVVASLAAFAVVILVARHHPAGEEHTLADYRGLARREPVAAAVLALALACLAGIPPGVMGLVAKVVVLRSLVSGSGWILVGVAAVNVVLGLFYYLRWAALLVAGSDTAPLTWRVRPAEGLALGAGAAGCLALSVWPQLVAGLLGSALH